MYVYHLLVIPVLLLIHFPFCSRSNAVLRQSCFTLYVFQLRSSRTPLLTISSTKFVAFDNPPLHPFVDLIVPQGSTAMPTRPRSVVEPSTSHHSPPPRRFSASKHVPAASTTPRLNHAPSSAPLFSDHTNSSGPIDITSKYISVLRHYTPEPRGFNVHAKTRPDLCEALPYFRAFQGGVHKDAKSHMLGYLL
jgi:hypothetical protein